MGKPLTTVDTSDERADRIAKARLATLLAKESISKSISGAMIGKVAMDAYAACVRELVFPLEEKVVALEKRVRDLTAAGDSLCEHNHCQCYISGGQDPGRLMHDGGVGPHGVGEGPCSWCLSTDAWREANETNKEEACTG